jgi:DNA polymerase delta subunit 2
MLVTGCIVAVMGTENANGEFEIIDLRVPDLPRQPQRWERDDSILALAKMNSGKEKIPDNERASGGKIAIVSGLGISGDEANSLTVDLLMEYLLGEACGPVEQEFVGKISRLIIAGNALAEASPLPRREEILGKKASRKYGYDSSAYNPAPTARLDNFLSTLLPSIPVTLIPGDSDPANVSLPQQPIHSAMLPYSRAYASIPNSNEPGWFHSTTNPWQGDIDGWRMMGTGGQPVDDIFKYVDGIERLEMIENLLRWRCIAPTAPDTLCKI